MSSERGGYKVLALLQLLMIIGLAIAGNMHAINEREQGRAEQEAKDKANAPKDWTEVEREECAKEVAGGLISSMSSSAAYDEDGNLLSGPSWNISCSKDGVAIADAPKKLPPFGPAKIDGVMIPNMHKGKPHKAAPKVPAVIDVEPGAPFTVGNGWTFTCITADFEKRTVTGTCPKDPPASLQGPPMFPLPRCTKDTNGLCTSPVAQLE